MTDETTTAQDFETKSDAGEGDKGFVRLWMSAIEQADREEKDWRKEAEAVVKSYRQDETGETGEGKARFNILFASVETTVPALYNSVPTPDVRRRFNDKDPVAKYGAQVIERALSYSVDSYDFDDVMETGVKDNELVGRAVTRVRYVPYLRADKESREESVVWQEVRCEPVGWANFRHGPAKTWADVPWIAFELFLTRDQLKALNPQFGGRVRLDVQISDDKHSDPGSPPPEIFKRGRVWEIWDKEGREVIFIAPSFGDAPLKREPDPLGLMDFFPVPRPLYAIKTSDSLVPIPPYRMFKAQAEELDRVTKRIMSLISVLKWRGIRDASIPEFENLKDAEDGELVPMADADALYAQAGGLEKAVWMLPIDKLISVIRELSAHREEIKQVIFEITGIADIMRGQTDPRETKGAQQIKTQWGSLRIQRRQAEVARYARDLFRLKAEIIANKFSDDTLKAMTGIELPTRQEKMLAQNQMQAPQMPMAA